MFGTTSAPTPYLRAWARHEIFIWSNDCFKWIIVYQFFVFLKLPSLQTKTGVWPWYRMRCLDFILRNYYNMDYSIERKRISLILQSECVCKADKTDIFLKLFDWLPSFEINADYWSTCTFHNSLYLHFDCIRNFIQLFERGLIHA